MKGLDNLDLELVDAAQCAIKKNYDSVAFNHTVGAAVRCKNGEIYVGVNVYSVHGACGEQIAIGNAITNGQREFVAIVAVRGENGEEILPPCGNCRQLLADYAPQCEVILSTAGKLTASELLPFAYQVE